jgi:hypothetical protein
VLSCEPRWSQDTDRSRRERLAKMFRGLDDVGVRPPAPSVSSSTIPGFGGGAAARGGGRGAKVDHDVALGGGENVDAVASDGRPRSEVRRVIEGERSSASVGDGGSSRAHADHWRRSSHRKKGNKKISVCG